MSRNFFQECETFKWNDIDWKNYFFAEVSALAYHDGTRAKRELNKIGNYEEIYEKYLGTETPINLERGYNKLYTHGGLLYAPPLR